MNDDLFFKSKPLLQNCPQQIGSQIQGEPDIKYSYLFYSKKNKFYFSFSTNPSYTLNQITYWKPSSKIVQSLPGIRNCINVVFHDNTDIIIMSCSSNDVLVYQFQNDSFVQIQKIVSNNAFITSINFLLDNSLTQIKFATISFNESEFKIWQVGQALPLQTIKLNVPSKTEILPSVQNFVFIPNSNNIFIFDQNSLIFRIVDINTNEIIYSSNHYTKNFYTSLDSSFQYHYKLNLIVVYRISKVTVLEQRISIFSASDATLQREFVVSFDKYFGWVIY